MQLQTVPFSAAQEVQTTSDVESLHFDGQGLVVVIGCEPLENNRVRGLKIRFTDASAFRYLDEVDLVRYWTSKGFIRGHHVVEVLSGGWSAEESIFQGYETKHREWLIVTGNGCISVFASLNPEITVCECEV